jgi:hypothetical protein
MSFLRNGIMSRECLEMRNSGRTNNEDRNTFIVYNSMCLVLNFSLYGSNHQAFPPTSAKRKQKKMDSCQTGDRYSRLSMIGR